MRILRLQAENVKRVKVIDITPDRHVNIVTGANGSGKSSTLDCIPWALLGKKAMADVPLARGADRGFIKLDLGEDGEVELRVNRTLRPDGKHELEILSPEGASYKSPAALGESLLGALSVDPQEFMHLKPAEQARVLGDLVGLTDGLKAIERERADVFELRTDVNRRLKDARAELAAAERAVQDENATPVDAADLLAQLETATRRNAVREDLRRQLNQWEERTNAKTAEINRLEAELREAREEREAMHDAYDRTEKQLMEELATTIPDETNIRAKLLNGERINADVAARRTRDAIRLKVSALESSSADYTAQLNDFDATQRELVASAPMPIDGLTLTTEGVFYDGLPLSEDQLSTALLWRVCVAIAMALKPKLKVIRVKQLSLLDNATKQMLFDIVRERDCQLWCEENDESGTFGYVMVDGTGHEAPAGIAGTHNTTEQNSAE